MKIRLGVFHRLKTTVRAGNTSGQRPDDSGWEYCCGREKSLDARMLISHAPRCAFVFLSGLPDFQR